MEPLVDPSETQVVHIHSPVKPDQNIWVEKLELYCTDKAILESCSCCTDIMQAGSHIVSFLRPRVLLYPQNYGLGIYETRPRVHWPCTGGSDIECAL